MVNITRPGTAQFSVESKTVKYHGLVIHGYGGNKEEMLGLAVNLAERGNFKLSVLDLPGHGDNLSAPFSLAGALTAIEEANAALGQPKFFIGHSLGARLGLLAGFQTAVVISIPGDAVFEGNQRQLLKVLRARRVVEAAAFGGLQEVLAAAVTPVPRMLALRAQFDLKSVSDLIALWGNRVTEVCNIRDCNHLDIISHPRTFMEIDKWLRKNLS